MHIIATAGHVDHGKSALVEALTGTHPDRLVEERRRGLTIDLGFAWTAGPDPIAFVDVPGHRRFVGTMLAGVGPAPAALFVVAADEGMRAQSYAHLRALHAFGVRHGVLAVTRADLADPGAALAEARAALAGSTLRGAAAVAVSARTGAGLDALRAALRRCVAALPHPDPDADVRLWADRAFTATGAGTVVTGTLQAGRLRVGDALLLDGREVRVRALQTLGQRRDEVTAAARVAVNLRGVPREDLRRGAALLTPGAWLHTDEVDVRWTTADVPPRDGTLHIGAAAVPVRLRALDAHHARLRLARRLPLRVGDRALWRDPGSGAIAGVTVLDVRPPALGRRLRGRDRAAALACGVPDAAALLRWHGLLRAPTLRAMGVSPPGAPVAGDWHADPGHWARLRERLRAAATAYAAKNPLFAAMPVEAAAEALGVDRSVVPALVAAPLALREGRIAAAGTGAALPAAVRRAVDTLLRDLAAAPFAVPDAPRLAALGLGARELAAAARAGLLLRLADTVVLAPEAPDEAVRRLATLDQPFTASDARRVWGTARRVAIPLLEHLDAAGRTVRVDDNRRRLAG